MDTFLKGKGFKIVVTIQVDKHARSSTNFKSYPIVLT